MWDISQSRMIRRKQKLIKKTSYLRHVRFEEPLNIIMDGVKRLSIITWNHNKPGKKEKKK